MSLSLCPRWRNKMHLFIYLMLQNSEIESLKLHAKYVLTNYCNKIKSMIVLKLNILYILYSVLY